MTAQQLIEQFQFALDNHWGYIWGTYGHTWTETRQKNLETKYASDPVKYADYKNGAKYGQKWIGHTVSDCSGLFYWAFKKLNQKMYHGSNTIWKSYTTNKSTLKNGKRTDGKEIKPGSAVFLNDNGNRHHIGLYIGNNTVIEAKSTQAGVVKSTLARWNETGELKGVEYEVDSTTVYMYPVIRSGNSGYDVKMLQQCLNTLGYQIRIDSKFGPETETALKKYQARHDLKQDGICGPLTWKAIETELGHNPFTLDPAEPDVPDKTQWIKEQLAIIEGAIAQIRAWLN